jgi:hypothetical protein
MNDILTEHDEDDPSFEPDTATRRLSERFATRPTTDSMRAIEHAIRQAPEAPLKGPRLAVLSEREKTHGRFDNTAMYAQSFKNLMRSTLNWDRLSDVQKEVLESKATKIARMLSGDPDCKDHWEDDAGFSTLVVERL